MEFKNTENKCYETTCGEKVWKSRNLAVCICVIRTNPLNSAEIQVLVTKRGEKVSHSGKNCLPCGYLDWDETVPMAAVRELWEETDLEISWKDLDFLELDSNPLKFLQNVTAHFLVYYTGDKTPSTANAAQGEVDSVEWVSFENCKNLDWAFDHGNRVENIVSNIELKPME